MDESLFVIGGINVLLFVPGLVQFIKNVTKLADAAAEILTVCVGVVCVGVAYSVNTGLIPEPAVGYIELAFVAVAGALAIAGYYKLIQSAAKGMINQSRQAVITALAAVQRPPAHDRYAIDGTDKRR